MSYLHHSSKDSLEPIRQLYHRHNGQQPAQGLPERGIRAVHVEVQQQALQVRLD